MALGWTFAILTAAQLALAVMNYIILKKRIGNYYHFDKLEFIGPIHMPT